MKIKMKTIIAFLLATFLFGCTQNTSKEETIAPIALKKFSKDQQNTAYEDFKFGMNPQQIKKYLPKKFDVINGCIVYDRPQFNKSGQMFHLRLETLSETYSSYESIKIYYQLINEYFSSKYGDPSITTHFPQNFEVIDNQLLYCKIWASVNKIILSGLNYKNDKYYCVCDIISLPYGYQEILNWILFYRDNI